MSICHFQPSHPAVKRSCRSVEKEFLCFDKNVATFLNACQKSACLEENPTLFLKRALQKRNAIFLLGANINHRQINSWKYVAHALEAPLGVVSFFVPYLESLLHGRYVGNTGCHRDRLHPRLSREALQTASGHSIMYMLHVGTYCFFVSTSSFLRPCAAWEFTSMRGSGEALVNSNIWPLANPLTSPTRRCCEDSYAYSSLQNETEQ